MSDTVHGMLTGHGVRVLLNTEFRTAEWDGKRVQSIRTHATDGTEHTVRAKVFIDATGDVYLCRAVGCETKLGRTLNGLTLCYRVR